jgi:hypothetical protein
MFELALLADAEIAGSNAARSRRHWRTLNNLIDAQVCGVKVLNNFKKSSQKYKKYAINEVIGA